MSRHKALQVVKEGERVELRGRSGLHSGLLVAAVAVTLLSMVTAPLFFDPAMWARSSGLYGSPGVIFPLSAPLAFWLWWLIKKMWPGSLIELTKDGLRFTENGSCFSVLWEDINLLYAYDERVRIVGVRKHGGVGLLLEIDPKHFYCSSERLTEEIKSHRPR